MEHNSTIRGKVGIKSQYYMDEVFVVISSYVKQSIMIEAFNSWDPVRC